MRDVHLVHRYERRLSNFPEGVPLCAHTGLFAVYMSAHSILLTVKVQRVCCCSQDTA